jgi:midasin (ATPase involved in ribosome maturation)
MRKIIPFIASDFKKDKIWLRRTKPNKREFQILVALGKGVRGPGHFSCVCFNLKKAAGI